MGFQEILADYLPIENQDNEGFEILKGTYRTSIVAFTAGMTTMEPKKECYKLELIINEILEGNGTVGRKFWRTYVKEDDESMKKMLNDLFTAGITLPKTSVADFESGLFTLADHEVTIRAWGWTPDKTRTGAPIPKEQQIAQQMFKIINQAKVKVKLPISSDVPF